MLAASDTILVAEAAAMRSSSIIREGDPSGLQPLISEVLITRWMYLLMFA